MFPAWRHAIPAARPMRPEDPHHQRRPMTVPFDSIPDAMLFGNRFATQEVPSREFPEAGMTSWKPCGWWRRISPSRRSLATSRRSSPPGWSRRPKGLSPRTCTKLHRPRGVSARQDRPALHPDARGPVSRTGRGELERVPRAHLRSDHARRPLPQVELALSGVSPRGINVKPEPGVRVATCTWCGRSSVATSMWSRSCAARAGQVYDRPRRRPASCRREHHQRCSRPRNNIHRAQGRHRRHQQPAASDQEGAPDLTSLHVDGASGGFVWPFLYPHSEWDFRLEQVHSINVSGHKFGLVYPGIRLADLSRDV